MKHIFYNFVVKIPFSFAKLLYFFIIGYLICIKTRKAIILFRIFYLCILALAQFHYFCNRFVIFFEKPIDKWPKSSYTMVTGKELTDIGEYRVSVSLKAQMCGELLCIPCKKGVSSFSLYG